MAAIPAGSHSTRTLATVSYLSENPRLAPVLVGDAHVLTLLVKQLDDAFAEACPPGVPPAILLKLLISHLLEEVRPEDPNQLRLDLAS